MLITRIILGLIGLGVVVFVHELGHFIAARLMGIGVEAFSIGWGKPILKKKIGDVEYRLGLFPVGGYCKMRGDADFEEIYRKNKEGIELEKGSYFAAHPFKRIVACLGGPLFNFVFAVLVFSVIWGIGGFEIYTPSNRIVLASEVIPSEITPSETALAIPSTPAEEAGLITGDRIVSIMGRETETFNDIREIITINPNRLLPLEVVRNNEILSLSITPSLDETRTRGIIGIYNWLDPVIGEVVPDGPAHIAGLLPGDRITRVDGNEIDHAWVFNTALGEMPVIIDIEYLRSGELFETALRPEYNDAGRASLGLNWEEMSFQAPRLPPHRALVTGLAETWNTFTFSVESLSMLFSGIDVTQAVSGPVRITYMTGEVAAAGFNQGIGSGFRSMAGFLALISIALCLMNLLPLPILDGGMILLFLTEAILRKPLNPKFVSAFQTVGVVLIAGLMFFAIFGDIRYLIGLGGVSN